ncbi:MAG: molybdate ABC transporter substrate-binding protein [Gammaproteobacteria bacterium]|nr:molybdate ABC transporter substrate-binding protein [Gammaproteobacteria bacterium]MCW8972304.1 molybdate ABC transporter substrate-binding protein [Gammaproteobacteria bacterium]MCW8992726.1 molybdate ABC transporter substrate-binding protein [Gammaproteobacteria bacterium]
MHNLRRVCYRVATLCLGALLLVVTPAVAEPLRVAAASDLRYALDEIIEVYRQTQPGADIEVIYGSSGKMTTQIINGAPYDMFFSADIAYPQKLKRHGLTATEPTVYAIGRIVIWSNSIDASRLTLEDLGSDTVRRIAIAQPAHAPYGRRAREALQSAGVWEAVQEKLVFGENIAHTAQMTRSGAAQVGIIALSLAKFPDLASHAYHLIDQDRHKPLTQGYIVTRRGGEKPGVMAFADFMTTAEAHRIMERYGFVLPGRDK